MNYAIGKHEFIVEGDTITGIWRGDMKVEDARQYLVLIEQILSKYPTYFAIGDTTNMGSLPAEARRLLVAGHKEFVYASGAVIGASLVMRSFVIMTSSALSVIGKNPTPLRFVKNLEEARAWIALQRQSLASKPHA